MTWPLPIPLCHLAGGGRIVRSGVEPERKRGGQEGGFSLRFCF